jgi:hypothetical protein
MMLRHGDWTLVERRMYKYISYAVDVDICISVLQEWEALRALLD